MKLNFLTLIMLSISFVIAGTKEKLKPFEQGVYQKRLAQFCFLNALTESRPFDQKKFMENAQTLGLKSEKNFYYSDNESSEDEFIHTQKFVDSILPQEIHHEKELKSTLDLQRQISKTFLQKITAIRLFQASREITEHITRLKAEVTKQKKSSLKKIKEIEILQNKKNRFLLRAENLFFNVISLYLQLFQKDYNPYYLSLVKKIKRNYIDSIEIEKVNDFPYYILESRIITLLKIIKLAKSYTNSDQSLGSSSLCE